MLTLYTLFTRSEFVYIRFFSTQVFSYVQNNKLSVQCTFLTSKREKNKVAFFFFIRKSIDTTPTNKLRLNKCGVLTKQDVSDEKKNIFVNGDCAVCTRWLQRFYSPYIQVYRFVCIDYD